MMVAILNLTTFSFDYYYSIDSGGFYSRSMIVSHSDVIIFAGKHMVQDKFMTLRISYS
jgi:hypothetical protein